MLTAIVSPNILIPVRYLHRDQRLSLVHYRFFQSRSGTSGRTTRHAKRSTSQGRTRSRCSRLQKKEALARVLEKASPALSKPLTPKTEAEMGKLKQRLVEAGFRSESAPAVFLSFKVLCGISFLMLSGGLLALISGINTNSFIKAAIAVDLASTFPNLP